MNDKQSPTRDPDAELLERLEEVESARRTRALIVAAIVAIVLGGGLVFVFTFSETFFRPELDVESGEEEVLSATDDPQCRGMITQITTIGSDYKELEPKLDALIGDDQAEIERLIDELDALKRRIEDAKALSKDAALRFDDSPKQLRDWFKYIDNELTLLQRVGGDRLAQLRVDVPDGGTLVETGGKPVSTKPMPERLSGATLAANEAFHKFRVWHTGGLHPCGEAAEGEKPWAEQ